jgi:hypothetical protein
MSGGTSLAHHADHRPDKPPSRQPGTHALAARPSQRTLDPDAITAGDPFAVAGNLAIQRQLLAYGIRAKLSVSQPGDPDEEEADRVADAMVSGAPPGSIHRKCAGCASGSPCPTCEEEPLQRKADHAAGSDPTRAAGHAVAALGSGGQPLPGSVRTDFEGRFGRDLSGVRVHTHAQAGNLARAIDARAYTHGQNIAFAPGEFAPHTTEGRRLLAHELTHVAQQADGPSAAGVVQRDATPAPAKADADKKDDKPDQPPAVPRPGVPRVWFQGSVLVDDRDFMKGEMRRTIGRLGLDGADEWHAMLLGWKPITAPLPYSAHARSSGGLRPRSAYDVAREDRDKALVNELAPMVSSVYQEVRADVITWFPTFETQLKANALDTLKASQARAKAEMVRYGLSSEQVQTRAARRRKEDGGWVNDPAEYKTVHNIADADSPAVKNMQAAAAVLLARRQKLDNDQIDYDAKQREFSGVTYASSCNQGYCPPKPATTITKEDLESKLKKLNEDRDKYNQLREQLTFQYPIIDRAADLETGSWSALNEIANSKSPADLATTLGERIADNLSDIDRTRDGIGNGHVNLWRRKPLVDLTKAQLETANNPAYNRVVDDKFKHEQPNVIDAVLEGIALLTLNIAAIVLAPATLGISLGVAAAVNVGLAAKHTVDYLYDKSLAGSDLRRAQALSADEPSLFWLAVEIVGAVVDVGTAVAAMKTLGPLAKAAQAAKEGKVAAETTEAIQAAARNLGKPELAERILAKAGKAEQAALEAAGASADEIKALTKVSTAIEKEAGETVGASVRTAAQTEVKFSKAGHLFSCSSPCIVLREKYADILAKDNQFYDRLVKLEQDAAKAAKARETATAAKDTKAIAEAEKEISRIKTAAKELEDGINAKYLKPTAGEAEVEAAQALKQAQAEEAFAKGKPGSRVDLTELSSKPTPERPPSVKADDPLWKDYEAYYTQRRASIIAGKAGVTRPLTWTEYSEFLGKFRRGTAYQETVLKGLESEADLVRKGQAVAGKNAPMQGMKEPEVLSNVGVAGKAEGETTKFVDQLIVDRATLGSASPKVEAFSNKSRDFAEIIKAEGDAGLARQVAADAQEALGKYGGSVGIRRQAVMRPNAAGQLEKVPFELFDQTVKVDKVFLVYDKSFIGDAAKNKQLVEAITRAAESVKGTGGQKVIVLFK